MDADLLADHLTHHHPLVYVGKSSVNHPHRARLIPLWRSFAAAHPLRYPHDPKRGAGQKNKHYKDFRDKWLPRVIQMMHAPTATQTDFNPASFYRQRRDQITRDNAPRCIAGFQFLVTSGKHQNLKYAPARFFLAAFYENEMDHAEVDEKFRSVLTSLDETELAPKRDQENAQTETLSMQTKLSAVYKNARWKRCEACASGRWGADSWRARGGAGGS